MGVCEEAPPANTMHWQQHERYSLGPAYDPSRDLSPNLPVHSSDSSSAGEGEGCSSSATSSTVGGGVGVADNNNSSGLLSASCCRFSDFSKQQGSPSGPLAPPLPAPLAQCKMEEAAGSGANCAGCGARICDRYYLLAVDRKWHVTCLQCSQCRQPLDGEVTCFARDGNIYCKKDYYRLFGMKRCARCQAAILSSELVMRARELVFHVHCFTCSACQSPLTKGDQFGMHGPNVFCQHHFEVAPHGAASSPAPPPHLQGPCGAPHQLQHQPPPPSPFPYHQPPFPSPAGDYSPNMPPSLPPQPPNNSSPCTLEPKSFFNGAPASSSPAPTTPRQKGRPRKRKPKDLEGLTANLDLNSDYLDVATPFGRSSASPGSLSSQSRTKRMRTSFKHHQLRTMKSYFAINHNPDAKDLKQLSQKTGLPKRVLQVWFQNARAKWRRMMIKQEGKIPSDKQGLDLDSPCGDMQQSHLGHSHSDYLHMQGDQSCSPQYMLGSPSSLDCV